MRFFKNCTEDDILAKILLTYFAFQHGAVGIYILLGNLDTAQWNTFVGMSKLLPMDVWGLMLLTSSVAFIITALQEHKIGYWFMLLAGIAGAIAFGILAMASISLSMTPINSINYIIIASIDVVIAIIGGVCLWLRKDS